MIQFFKSIYAINDSEIKKWKIFNITENMLLQFAGMKYSVGYLIFFEESREDLDHISPLSRWLLSCSVFPSRSFGPGGAALVFSKNKLREFS